MGSLREDPSPPFLPRFAKTVAFFVRGDAVPDSCSATIPPPPITEAQDGGLLRHECGMRVGGQSLLSMPFLGSAPIVRARRRCVRTSTMRRCSSRHCSISENAVQPVGPLAGTPHRNPLGDSACVNIQNPRHFIAGFMRSFGLTTSRFLPIWLPRFVVVWRKWEFESFSCKKLRDSSTAIGHGGLGRTRSPSVTGADPSEVADCDTGGPSDTPFDRHQPRTFEGGQGAAERVWRNGEPIAQDATDNHFR